jgi:tRNA pseudouridine38-40 synthase
MVTRYFIKLAYDGSDFFGWQTQKNKNTVQDQLTAVLQLSLNDKSIKLTGCGRTDTGVHASCYYAHFDTLKPITDIPKAIYKLNNFLPHSIAVAAIFEVDDAAHTRFDATSRTYQYFLHREKSPFHNQYSLLFLRELNFEKMNTAAQYLLSVKDFSAFAKAGSDNKTVICNVTNAKWERKGEQWCFTITADRFLRNMVRAIVGTLLEVGLGKISFPEFKAIIESRKRGNAGSSAPANALFLSDVQYDFISDKKII